MLQPQRVRVFIKRKRHVHRQAKVVKLSKVAGVGSQGCLMTLMGMITACGLQKNSHSYVHLKPKQKILQGLQYKKVLLY